MSVSMANNRKRTRSQEDYDYVVQSKQFINEQMITMSSQTKMKEIHDKTIRMLFQNANPKSFDNGTNNNNNNEIEMKTSGRVDGHPHMNWQEFGENICLMGDGQVNYIDANSKFVNEKISRRCRFCAKPSSIQPTDCINCNLEICEFCGISCIQCNAPLCMSCVQLFGCCDNTTDMNACCERCKMYNTQ